jgi:hypothetical protein
MPQKNAGLAKRIGSRGGYKGAVTFPQKTGKRLN